jgi:hypothetical protein
MEKIDIKKKLNSIYNPSTKEISIVDVPQMNFVMADGSGDPNKAKEYQEAIEALYAISYSIKFAVKKEQQIDYGVMPLEGLWWADDMTSFAITNKDNWKWTAMIMQPEFVTNALFDIAIQQVIKKKVLPALLKTRFRSFHEGQSAQIMYIGPFADEGPTIRMIHQFAKEHDYVFDGLVEKHHEIYLSDFRRAEPNKLKTIIRQPIRPIIGKSK